MERAVNKLELACRNAEKHFMDPVAKKYELSKAELEVLLFLSENPDYNTARDIVEYCGLVKSHVSLAVSGLEEKGLLERFYYDGNHRSIHLEISEDAGALVAELTAAKNAYGDALKGGLTEDEAEQFIALCEKITNTVKKIT